MSCKSESMKASGSSSENSSNESSSRENSTKSGSGCGCSGNSRQQVLRKINPSAVICRRGIILFKSFTN